MSFELSQFVEFAKHIAEDSNRGFWAKLGAQVFESLLPKAGYIVSALRTTPENEIAAAIEKDAALKIMVEEMQKLAAPNQQFAELAKEALQNLASVTKNAKLAENIGVVVQGAR